MLDREEQRPTQVTRMYSRPRDEAVVVVDRSEWRGEEQGPSDRRLRLRPTSVRIQSHVAPCRDYADVPQRCSLSSSDPAMDRLPYLSSHERRARMPPLLRTQLLASEQTGRQSGSLVARSNNGSYSCNSSMTNTSPSRAMALEQCAAVQHELRMRNRATPNPMALRPKRALIEVAPDFHVRLRGSDETWMALIDDFFVPTHCAPCDKTLFCIQDAGYMLCPICRVVQPMEDMIDPKAGGVGMGVTYEDLVRWQPEIQRERQRLRELSGGRDDEPPRAA